MFSAATDRDASALFEGVVFLLSGFDLSTQTQLSAALEQHGGVNVGEYNESCTHIIVSRAFLWDDPVCAAARKDGKYLCTELWVTDCLDLGIIQDVNHVVYRPLRDSQGVLGSKNLVVCLTGYQGQARRNVMRMVHLMGAHFSKPLIANRVTHLVCYKFEGEKFNLAKQLGLKLVNHLWLEDCLRTWALLSEEDYSKSGLEVELSEAEAKDSEDDGMLKSNSCAPKVSNGAVLACLEGARGEVNFQMQMENTERSFSSEKCPQEQRRKSVHLSPNFSSPNNNIVTSNVSNPKKGSTGNAIVCEMQAEKKEATSTSPVVLGAKRKKSMGSPEMASNSKRKTSTGRADDGCHISRELDNQHGGEKDSSDEAVCEVQVEKGSLCNSEKPFKLTTPAKRNGTTAKMEVVSKNPVSNKDENRALSPSAGGIACDIVPCDVENMPSALLNDGTPQTAEGKKHSNILGTSLDSIVSNNKSLLHSKGGTEDIQREITDEGLQKEITETESTPGTCEAKEKNTLLPPSGASAKEHENNPHMKCRSANKSTEMKRPPRNNSSRNGRLKVAQKILCTDGDAVHLSSGELSEVNLPVKGSLPEINTEKGEIADQERDVRKLEEQSTSCILDEHAKEMQVELSEVLIEDAGNVEVHHSGESVLNVETVAMVSGSKKTRKHKQTPNLKIAEKLRPVTGPTGETMTIDKENTAHLTATDKKKTVGNNTLLKGRGTKKGDKQTMPCIETTVKENACERQVRELKLLKDEDHDTVVHKRGQLVKANSKLSGTKEQGKLSKKSDTTSTKRMKSLTGEKASLDKENAAVCQIHDAAGEPKTPHEALVVRKSGEKVASSDNVSQNVKNLIQRCFALSGRQQEIKPLQALVKKLGGKLCRNSHQWSHQTTHLIIVGQLRRTEKLFAAAAAGRWILREDYLKDSSEAGTFLNEKNYEWHGPGMTKDGSISFEAPRKWRELRENTGYCSLEGLRILLYGECLIPSLDTLRRAIRAGGADLVATCPPYTRFLASKVDFAIVNPGTPKNDQWIQEFLSHKVACVTTDFFVDFVCKPSSCLDRHILYDTHHLVQVFLTRSQASNVGAKVDTKEYKNSGEECGGEEIACVTCGRSDREDVMLLCGDDNGSGCGTAMHIDCCKPPLDKVPAHDWYCVQCTKPPSPLKKRKKKTGASKG